MHLKALDQFHISSVSANTIAPGTVFEVSDAAGEELMKKHPKGFERVRAPARKAPEPKAADPAASGTSKAKGR
jgi:hypothetical protein